MKFLIVTIYDHNPNYGNRLQNYATQHILYNLFDGKNSVETIDYSMYDRNESAKKLLKYYFHKMTGYHFTSHKEYWKVEQAKVLAFERFNKRYINTVHCDSIESIPEADFYAVGSDQVWNPLWYHENPIKEQLFLLSFTSPEKKVCISPSVGISQLPEDWKDAFRRHWNNFTNISVREQAGAEIIEELTGKKASVLIDPTLMLSPEEWRKIIRRPVKYRKPYILTYFLGEITEKIRNDIEFIKKEKGLQVKHLNDKSDFNTYISDPGDFINLVDQAEIVMTDSFHACVFSFLFKKPFLLYQREGGSENMISRIQTLFDTFDMNNRFAPLDIQTASDIFNTDYSIGYRRLAELRDKFYKELLSNLGEDKG